MTSKKAFLPIFLLLFVGVFVSFRMIADKKSNTILSENGEVYVEPYIAEEHPNDTRNQAIQQTIMNVIRDAHFSPKAINDDFSQRVFSRYMEMTDYGKLFLLKSDIDEFRKYELKIDDEIKENSTELFSLVSNRYQQRLKEAESYYTEILKTPFSFNDNDEIELDGKKLAWCNTVDELKNRWKINLKYRTLARYDELKEEETKGKDKPISPAEHEVKARESVKKNMDNFFKRLKKINENDRFATYLNSVCHVVDPHTDFFPPKDKQRFDEEMSGKFFGIGAQLQDDNGTCKITSILVGTPAWKNGKLKKEDIILKVAQGAEEPVDIAGWDLEDIVSIIRGKEGTEVRLTIKHVDGSIEQVSLLRGKVEREETFAKSAIIKSGAHQIGYILLPEFYADFNERNGRRCAADMYKEIEKLKSEKVNGIIVDLRNNGGGSLSDVVDIGGFFIPKGPIVQVKSKELPAQALDDRDPGVLYDGPLVILINQGSASASEILAAAMQDYKRGIVMGANSFGKGTVQRVFPLEDFFRGDESLLATKDAKGNPMGLGSIKLTLQKFYRINGGSTQLKGVTPDILMPDLYDKLDIGERKDSNSLAWDQVAKADYKTVKQSVDFNTLIAASQKRIAGNDAFSLIKNQADFLKKQSDENRYSLNEKKYAEKLKSNKELSKKLEESQKKIKSANIINLKADMATINMDTTNVAKNKEWLELLKKDPYISEAGNVLSDWILQEKNVEVGLKK